MGVQGNKDLLILTGFINQSESKEMASLLAKSASDSKSDLMIDCSKLEYLNSHAVGLLLQTCNTLYEKGLSLRLIAPPQAVLRTLEIVGITSFLIVNSSLAEAKEASQRKGR